MSAERAVIGSILLSPAALDDVSDILVPADMADVRHETILEAAINLARRGQRVDAVTICDALGPRGVAHIGGPEYLHEVSGEVVSAASAGHHAKVVAKEAARRRLLGMAVWIQQQIDDGVDPTELQDEARARLDSLPTAAGVEVKALASTITETLRQLEMGDAGYLATGWPDLDKLIHGWRPGVLHVVGARPGGGKSIIGTQAALSMAQRGKAVAVASMEMSDHELNLRLLAQTAMVGMDSLVKGSLSDMEWQRIADVVPGLVDTSLFVDDAPHQSIARIRSHARAVARRADLGMVVVDYLQQIQPPAHMRRAPRHEQVGDTSRALKMLARELKVPVLALAQVNRNAPDRGGDRKPAMSDLRESGAIEADADVVMLLHRDSDETPDLEVIVEKSRHGRRGHFVLNWQAHFARVMSHTDPYGRQAS